MRQEDCNSFKSSLDYIHGKNLASQGYTARLLSRIVIIIIMKIKNNYFFLHFSQAKSNPNSHCLLSSYRELNVSNLFPITIWKVRL